MASSEEEGEILPQRVTDYHFVDYMDQPVSFAILPFQWSENDIPGGSKLKIFLRGTVDNGLQKIYNQAIAWTIELSYVHPEISVLTKQKIWIKLQRPRKSFESIIRNTLVTVHCLHYVKKNPETSHELLWSHLLKSFSSYEVEPDDLLDHVPLISEAVKRDKDLEKSKVYCTSPLKCHGFSQFASVQQNAKSSLKRSSVLLEDRCCLRSTSTGMASWTGTVERQV